MVNKSPIIVQDGGPPSYKLVYKINPTNYSYVYHEP